MNHNFIGFDNRMLNFGCIDVRIDLKDVLTDLKNSGGFSFYTFTHLKCAW